MKLHSFDPLFYFGREREGGGRMERIENQKSTMEAFEKLKQLGKVQHKCSLNVQV